MEVYRFRKLFLENLESKMNLKDMYISIPVEKSKRLMDMFKFDQDNAR
jgi:hypothetical protein